MSVQSVKSKPKITRYIIANTIYEIGRSYIVFSKERKKIEKFEGILVGQTDNCITLKHHKHGYLVSFMKVDFFIGERQLKEA